jgi:hypothetical protein
MDRACPIQSIGAISSLASRGNLVIAASIIQTQSGFSNLAASTLIARANSLGSLT